MDAEQKRKKPCNTKRDEESNNSIPATHCCKCHMETIDKLVISIHVEYKKTISDIEEKHGEAQSFATETNMRMKQMECELSSLKAKWRSDMEIRENTVSTLRNIIKNVREDI